MSYRKGNFYVSAYIATAPDRSRVVAENQFFTFADAKAWLDGRDSAGNIEEWLPKKNQRQFRARRTVDGNWFVPAVVGEKPLIEPSAPTL